MHSKSNHKILRDITGETNVESTLCSMFMHDLNETPRERFNSMHLTAAAAVQQKIFRSALFLMPAALH